MPSKYHRTYIFSNFVDFFRKMIYYYRKSVNKEGMYVITALNVANSVLDRAFIEGIDISPMKIQKMVYFIYKRYYQNTKQPLFSEGFEAWRYGPVVPTIYNAFKRYAARPIKSFFIEQDGKAYSVDLNSSAEFRKAIDYVWQHYSQKDGITLSNVTHRKDTAWYKAVKNSKLCLSNDDILTEEWLQ